MVLAVSAGMSEMGSAQLHQNHQVSAFGAA